MLAALFLTLAACSEADFGVATRGDGGGAADGDVEPGTLRLDVSPADDALGLLPQSFILPPEDYLLTDGQLEHALDATVLVDGLLTAETVQGWAASGVGPLEATVTAQRASLRQGGATSVDEDGRFSMALPGSQPYSLTITPRDATQTPLVVFTNRNVGQGLSIEEVIGAGAPVYGRVTDDSGARVAGVALHLTRTDTDIRGATFYSDEAGWFVARAEPGYAHALVVEGDADALGGPIPTLEVPFLVESEDGAEVNVDVGARQGFSIRFRVAEEDGTRVSRPRARATSESLALGHLEVEVEGQDNGEISFLLPGGDWRLEVIPSDGKPTLSPRVLTGLTVDGDADLGSMTLARPVTLSGIVRDATEEHSPAGGVAVTAISAGYGGFTFSGVTDASGAYELSVPRTAFRVEATPSGPDLGAYTYAYTDLQDGGADVDIVLPAGTELRGVLRSDGALVPFAQVLVYDHVEGLLLARTLTGADGSYAVRVDVPDWSGGSDTGGDTGP
jgi:hypothetical protein